MTITVNSIELVEELKVCIKAKLVPMVVGSPGVGKSSIIAQVADHFKLKLIDIRLAQCDPCDLNGVPYVKDGIASWTPFNVFPLEDSSIPEGYKGWLILFDEMNSAPLSVQSSAYKIVLDRYVGQHKLHKNVVMVCAGNLSTDKAVVNRLSTAMQSRLIHLHLELENEHWLNWAIGKIDYRIISYIEFSPISLNTFKPNHDEYTFASARTWEFVSKLITGIDRPSLALICGAVGESEGRKFYGYCQIFNDLPTIKDILSKPETSHVPTEPSTLYAISGLLTEHLKESNAVVLLKYISRLPIEFGVITLRNIIKRYPDSITYPAIKDWMKTYSKELFL